MTAFVSDTSQAAREAPAGEAGLPARWANAKFENVSPRERELLEQIDPAGVPAHIACIMDGNGRWAKKRARERIFGHHVARDAVRQTVRTCHSLGVRYLTLYTFSSENWRRPRAEVVALMKLLKDTLSAEKQNLHESGVRLRVFGELEAVPAGVRQVVDESIELMRHNTGLNLNLAINYGARQEILMAARELAARAARGELDPARIELQDLERGLYSAGMPDPELLIRTGGEKRVSNFLLWQLAYTELWVSPVLWPDFDRASLLEAVRDYQQRDRRFGGL